MFAKEVYIARRATLVGKMGENVPQGSRGIALFIGNAESPAQYWALSLIHISEPTRPY